MQKKDEPSDVFEGLSRQELLDLHTHYESVVKDMLDLFFQYLNFYTGLLVAILAATLTGLLSLKSGDLRLFALLLGPILNVILAILGYLNVSVFYSRYIEAWVTALNIESMLGIRYVPSPIQGKHAPVYPSKMGGFLPMIERTTIESTLERARKEQWTAEKVGAILYRAGNTLRNARYTFIAFSCISVGLSGIIITAFYI